jgi:uncharacterized membrane protein YuzA (DUF378 family)
MELTTKNLVYVVSSIGAILWGYFGVTGNFPVESLLGLDATTAGYLYAVVGLAGALSLLYTAAVWDDIDPTVIALLYILADIGAVLWGYYWYSGQTPTEAFGFLDGSIGTVVYLAVAAGGLLSLLIAFSFMDEDSNTTDASDALDG